MITKIKSLLTPAVETQDDLLLEFKVIYQANHDYIRNLIYWMIRNDDVHDLVQETFVKAWGHFSKFNREAQVKTWLHRIALNTVYDYYRKQKQPELKQLEVADNSQVDTKDLIDKALLELDLNSREVLVLHYKFGHSLEEISEILQLKLGTVKSRLHNAKEKFRAFCDKEGINYE